MCESGENFREFDLSTLTLRGLICQMLSNTRTLSAGQVSLRFSLRSNYATLPPPDEGAAGAIHVQRYGLSSDTPKCLNQQIHLLGSKTECRKLCEHNVD